MDNYAEDDAGRIDYQLYPFRAPGDSRPLRAEGRPLEFRGPPVDDPVVCCLGSAHTFGRHCPEPYPRLLSRALDVPVANWARGGFGPRAYLALPALIEAINRTRVVVLQVTAARGQPSALGPQVSPFSQKLPGTDGRAISAAIRLAELEREVSAERFHSGLQEMRAGYRSDTLALLDRIAPPVVLLWFSKRAATALPTAGPLRARLGGFPQLVDEALLESIHPRCAAFVSCASRAGLPQRLATVADGPTRYNRYYPSPEMHAAAARRLAPAVRALLR